MYNPNSPDSLTSFTPLTALNPKHSAPANAPRTKLHLASSQGQPVTPRVTAKPLEALPLAEARVKTLQSAILLEIKHHMNEVLEFGSNDPFFDAFVEYHRRRIHFLQQALAEAFHEEIEPEPVDAQLEEEPELA